MRIIFAGTPSIAAHTLDALVDAGFDVVGVLTREDAQAGRQKTLTESAVATSAKRLGIESRKANRVSDEVSSWISALNPDLGVIVAYGSILKSQVLELPAKGWINLHYSLLPKFPGAAPVQHAILNGQTTTGVTVFRLDEGIDTGPILAQAVSNIGEDQSSGELLEALTSVGSDLLVDTLTNLEERLGNQKPQQLPTGEPVAGKISRSFARLNCSEPALAVHNFVRAMNPEPVAWFEFQGSPIRVLKTSLAEQEHLSIGEAKLLSGELVLGCSDSAVTLVKVQPAGKKEMSGADWFRGLRVESISIL
jgi:methionyl-tRNA formyltransferase